LEAPSLLAACAIAFTAVFVVLGSLALVIQIISLVLPAPRAGTDAAVAAAIAGTVARFGGGARVTSIVEEP
jgi:hypothetical protein